MMTSPVAPRNIYRNTMGNLALPFSLSDILERVIPGSLLLAAWFFGLDLTVDLPEVLKNAALASAVFLATSYALGVALNALSSFVKIRDYRRYWTADPDERQQAVQAAIEAHFGLKVDTNTWSLCYGTCTKNGYSANTQLFLGLEVFCRAMTVTSLLSGLQASEAQALFPDTPFLRRGARRFGPHREEPRQTVA